MRGVSNVTKIRHSTTRCAICRRDLAATGINAVFLNLDTGSLAICLDCDPVRKDDEQEPLPIF